MKLIIGCGLVGTELLKKISHEGKVVVIDPNVDKITSDEINDENYIHLKQDFEEFLKESYYHGLFECIINLSYPVKRDIGTDPFPKSHIFNNSIESHIGFYYKVMKSASLLLKPNHIGSVISASSIYSTFIPRNELYKDSKRITPVDYVASKSSIVFMSKFFAKNYKNNIYYNTISFGGVYNNHEQKFVTKYGAHTKSGNMLNVNELIQSFLFLSKAHINKINGIDLIVDDGFTL